MNKWIVNSSEEGERLLTYLRQRIEKDFSTKDIRWAVEHHRCQVNGIVERFCSRRLKAGDKIVLSLAKKPNFELDSSRILHERDAFLIYNKPAGISTEDLGRLLGLIVVHRLDRDTTGVILFAKTKAFQFQAEALFRERKVKKSYLALVHGAIKNPSGAIENFIGKLSEKEGEGKWGVVSKDRGAYAKTEWTLERSSSHYSLVRCHPLTGRTHQLRVHLSSIGHPIVGDLRYGDRKASAFRPLLHAFSLSFVDSDSKEEISVEAPVPEDFVQQIPYYFN